MKTADEFLKLERTCKELRTVSATFAEAVKDQSCDKKGIGFNKDSRFAAFEIHVSFDSWRGYYGNSGCSNVISFSNTDVVKRAFINFLNNHYTDIFKAMADEIEKQSVAARDKYVAELKAELSRLEQES